MGTCQNIGKKNIVTYYTAPLPHFPDDRGKPQKNLNLTFLCCKLFSELHQSKFQILRFLTHFPWQNTHTQKQIAL
jgi:hypothetical protein